MTAIPTVVKYADLAIVWAALVSACAGHVPPITVPPLPPSAATTVLKGT